MAVCVEVVLNVFFIYVKIAVFAADPRDFVLSEPDRLVSRDSTGLVCD